MYPFFRTFEGIVISGEEKLKKPDERIFRLLLERYELAAEECLFIDDSLVNVRAAEHLGFEVIHLADPSDLKDNLACRGYL